MIGSNNVLDEKDDDENIAAAIFRVAELIRIKQSNAIIVSVVGNLVH
jgi:hypothetical protein